MFIKPNKTKIEEVPIFPPRYFKFSIHNLKPQVRVNFFQGNTPQCMINNFDSICYFREQLLNLPRHKQGNRTIIIS